MKWLGLLGGGLAAIVATVVLWPGQTLGPEPILYGRDACAHCAMHLSQPGFAAERRLPDGKVAKYDDIGCLLAELAKAPAAPFDQVWVEDSEGAELVALESACLVRSPSLSTPMASGIVAFADRAAADAAAARAGTAVTTAASLLEEIRKNQE